MAANKNSSKKPSDKLFKEAFKNVINVIKAHKRTTAQKLQEEIGAEIGISAHAIDYWGRGYPPSNFTDLENFVQALARRMKIADRQYLERLLKTANYKYAEKFFDELVWSDTTSIFEPKRTLTDELIKHAIPFERPPRVPYFTTRYTNDAENELVQILAHIYPGNTVTLCGPGGIGKSALAAEVVWSLAPDDLPPKRFPDGIIHHDFYLVPQVDAALENIARMFHEDLSPTPATAAKRSLAGRKVLLVLDGVENADDLRAILSIAGSCGVLITTRSRKDAVGTRFDISYLPTDKAISLLKNWGGSRVDNDPSAARICELVGGLPLAVRLVGSYLASHEQNASEYVTWLETTPLVALNFGKRQHESIPLLLERSIERVSNNARSAFSVSGVLAFHRFSQEVLSTALEIPVDLVGRLLGELVNYSFLKRIGSFYEVTHALIHTYAQKMMPVSDSIVRGLANYYIELANTQTPLEGEGYDKLNNERPHFISVLSVCLKNEQWVVIENLAKAVDKYLNEQGFWTERIFTNQSGLNAAKAWDNEEDQIIFLDRLGDVYQKLGNWDTAKTFYNEELNLSRKVKDRSREAFALTALGEISLLKGQWLEAIHLHQASLRLFEQVDERYGASRAMISLGDVYRRQGRWSEAISEYDKSLAIAYDLKDEHLETKALNGLGYTNFRMMRWSEAIKFYEKSLTIARRRGERLAEGQLLQNLGAVHKYLDDLDKAIKYIEDSLMITKKLGARYIIGESLNNLGMIYYKQKDFDKAIEFYQRSYDLFSELGERNGQAATLANLASVYRQKGELGKAIPLYEQSLPILQELGERQAVAMTIVNIGTVYREQNQWASALHNYNQGLSLFRDLKDLHDEGITLTNMGILYKKRGQLEDAVRYWQEALEKLNNSSSIYKETIKYLEELDEDIPLDHSGVSN